MTYLEFLQTPVVFTCLTATAVSIASFVISAFNMVKSSKINSAKEKEIVLLRSENERLNNLIQIEANKRLAEERNSTEILIAKVQTREKLELLNRAKEETQPIIIKIDHVWELLQTAKEILKKFKSTASFDVDKSAKELFKISKELKDNYGELGIKIKNLSEKAERELHAIKGQFETRLKFLQKNNSTDKYTFINNECHQEIDEFYKWITEHQEVLSNERRKFESERFNSLLKLFE